MAEEKEGTATWLHVVGNYVENFGKTFVKIILKEIQSLEKLY